MPKHAVCTQCTGLTMFSTCLPTHTHMRHHGVRSFGQDQVPRPTPQIAQALHRMLFDGNAQVQLKTRETLVSFADKVQHNFLVRASLSVTETRVCVRVINCFFICISFMSNTRKDVPCFFYNAADAVRLKAHTCTCAHTHTQCREMNYHSKFFCNLVTLLPGARFKRGRVGWRA